MKKPGFSAVLVAVCMTLANQTCASDLLDMVNASLSQDADLAQARAAYEASKQAIPIARAALLPQISGGWGRAYNEIKTDGFPRQSYWQNGWTFQAAQPLFDWAKWTTYQQADLVVAQGAVQFAAAQQAAMLKAVRAYFDALAAEDELERTSEYLAAIDEQHRQTRRKRAAGEATVIDERDIDVALAQARIQNADARQDMEVKRRVLQQMSGKPFSPLSGLSAGTKLPRIQPEDPDVWAGQASSSGYDVQSKQLDLEIAKMDSKKARAAHYPVVSLTGTYTPAGAASGYARPTTTTTAMLQVMMPLFSGGEIQARLKQSLAQQDKAQDAIESASFTAEKDARENYAAYLKARVRSISLEQLLQTSKEALAATETGFKVGSRTQVDVLRALDSYFTVRRDLMRSRYEVIVSSLQLKANVASLTIDDISYANTLLCCAKTSDNGPSLR